MNNHFQAPKSARIFLLVMLALVALDFSNAIDPDLQGPIRVTIGLCAIAAVASFLFAFMRSRL